MRRRKVELFPKDYQRLARLNTAITAITSSRTCRALSLQDVNDLERIRQKAVSIRQARPPKPEHTPEQLAASAEQIEAAWASLRPPPTATTRKAKA
jgi:hypothetical protein